MLRLSSKRTFFFKRVFPIMWFGFLALFVVLMLVFPCHAGSAKCPPAFPFVLIPLIMAVFGGTLIRFLVAGLVDEVWDGGDHLLVISKGREQRIPLSNIINFSYAPMGSPPRVTLTLRDAGRDGGEAGKKIAYIPQIKMTFSPQKLWNPPQIDELIERIDRARRQMRD